MQRELEAGHDAETAASAAQSPIEVGVLAGGGADEAAIRQHDADAAHIVAGEPVFAHEPARAAAQGEAADARARDQAAGGRESFGRTRRIDIAP
jgi:hypothetical protein